MEQLETTGGNPRKKAKKSKGTPPGPRGDPIFIARLFESQSTLLHACFKADFDENELREFAERALSKRCKTARTRGRVLKFVLDYYDFARTRNPPAPFFGESSVISISNWLDLLKFRGPSVPPMARYSLVVFSEALGLNLPVNHPAVISSAKCPRGIAKCAPCLPTELVFRLEKEACNREQPEGLRLYCSLLFLLTTASLRFADTAGVSEMFLTDTAVCGHSINAKDRNGAAMRWATVRAGINSNGAWVRPLFRLWDRLKPANGKVSWLFPYVNSEWKVDIKRRATYGVAQAAFRRLTALFGFEGKFTLRSPRNWFTTCAGQLLYSREHREKLGRWAPGSVMPDHYDRAVCATELRLRNEIIAKLNLGWRPSKEYETPTALELQENLTQMGDIEGGGPQRKAKKTDKLEDISSSSEEESTSVTSTMAELVTQRENIANLDV